MNDPDWTEEWTEVTRARDRRRGSQETDASTPQDAATREGDAIGPGAGDVPQTGPPPARGGPRTARRPKRPHRLQTEREHDHQGEQEVARKRKLRRRAMPLAAVAAISFGAGSITSAGSAREDLAKRFIADWAGQDFKAMYAELSPKAQSAYPAGTFAEAYREAQRTATFTAIDPDDASERSGAVEVGIGIETRLFGGVDGKIRLPISDQGIDWAPHLVFPGLVKSEKLGRRLSLGNRAAILARNGTPLAEGTVGARSSPLGSAAIDVAGRIGSADAELRGRVEGQGFPGDQPTGISGLELAFNSRLAGVPSGELLAVAQSTRGPEISAGVDGRVLARGTGKPGEKVTTTIDPRTQQLAVSALGGRVGGVVVLDARNGQVRAMAGQVYSDPQPPGSVFKVITATAAFEAGKAKLSDTYPVLTEINAGGRVIANAHDESCGGTFTQSFALSCNTVFAPLGVEVGESKLREVAERYGFNQPPTLFNAEARAAAAPLGASIPEAIGSGVDLAASSIGQGRLLATPLSMASVAQTIAAGGVRSPTSIVTATGLRPEAGAVRVTSKEIARVITGLMRAVVSSGTGFRGRVAGVAVAGKTGTAELGPKPIQPPAEPLAPGEEPPDPEQIVDAWFIAFAPAGKPKLAIGVVLVNADADGGDVAAPLAAQILASALRK